MSDAIQRAARRGEAVDAATALALEEDHDWGSHRAQPNDLCPKCRREAK